MIKTVNGWITPQQTGIADAHNHVWIEPVSGVAPGSPTLTDRESIALELGDYSKAGGGTIVDCQPGGCGRNGKVLHWLSKISTVHIVACTGYHLRKYYPDGYWLFTTSVEEATEYFIKELRNGLTETRDIEHQIDAGFVKIACQATLEDSPVHLMEAAVNACFETGAALEVHTEKGSHGEAIARTLIDLGLSPQKLILCHVDKHPDYQFHHDLLSAGITLEYDTFYRPKYQPKKYLWPLLERVISAGYEDQIVIATDMAEASLWSRLGDGPGLVGLIQQIMPKLEKCGLSQKSIQKLVGGNIRSCLSQQLISYQ